MVTVPYGGLLRRQVFRAEWNFEDAATNHSSAYQILDKPSAAFLSINRWIVADSLVTFATKPSALSTSG
jgi:hypothetical protein